MKIYQTSSPEETFELGRNLGKELPPNRTVCFFGELAAGKTTLIKGIVEGLDAGEADEVSSPTFSYLNIYKKETTVFHFDLYRLTGIDDFIGLGFDEFFYQDGICLIEWSERIKGMIPKEKALNIHLSHLGEDQREIKVV